MSLDLRSANFYGYCVTAKDTPESETVNLRVDSTAGKRKGVAEAYWKYLAEGMKTDAKTSSKEGVWLITMKSRMDAFMQVHILPPLQKIVFEGIPLNYILNYEPGIHGETFKIPPGIRNRQPCVSPKFKEEI